MVSSITTAVKLITFTQSSFVIVFLLLLVLDSDEESAFSIDLDMVSFEAEGFKPSRLKIVADVLHLCHCFGSCIRISISTLSPSVSAGILSISFSIFFTFLFRIHFIFFHLLNSFNPAMMNTSQHSSQNPPLVRCLQEYPSG